MTDALAANDRWLRDLARRLVRDPARAADAVQETWLSWTKSGAEGPPHRGWLRSVLHNAITQIVRSDSRRQRREFASPRFPPLERGASSIVERLESQRAVIDAVVALEEPYRTVILLRFYESLPPRAIASRLAIPVATVKTRLARGLDRLRESLKGDDDPGAPRRTYPILLPLLAKIPLSTATLPSLGLGVLTVNLVSKAALSLAAATMLFATYRWLEPDASSVSEGAEPTTVVNGLVTPETTSITPVVERREIASTPVPAATPDTPSATVAAANEETLTIRGHLLDADGSPLPGLEVRFASRGKDQRFATAICSGDGSFELAIPLTTGTLACSQPGFLTLYESFVDDDSATAEHVVVAARSIRLAGTVIDDRGVLVDAARITIPWKRLVAPRIQFDLARSTARTIQTTAREGGRFVFEEAPRLPESASSTEGLVATHDDYDAARAALPRSDRDDLRIVLPTRSIPANALNGTVVDRIGLPIGGAFVACGDEAQSTDSLGRFSFPLAGGEEDPSELRAVALGLRAVSVPRPVEGWSSHVRVVLGEDALRIRGKVVDRAGEPVKGVRVTLDSGMVLAANPSRWTEEVAGGFDESTATDSEGRFEIGGLLDRNYVLHAIDVTTLANLKSKAIPAGSEDVTLVLDPERVFSKLRGRIVDHTGNGVSSASVTCQLPYHIIETKFSTSASNCAGPPIAVDAAGRFEIENAPLYGLVLSIAGERVEQTNFTVSEGFDRHDELTITVECSASFRLELDPIDPAARFLEIRDANDRTLFVTARTYGGWSKNNSSEIVDGRTSVLAVSDRAAWAVLRRADFSEIRRFEIRLSPEDVNVLTGR